MRRLAYLSIVLMAVALGALVAARIMREGPGRTATAKPVDRVAPAEVIKASPTHFTGVVFPRQQVEVSSSVEAKVAEVVVQLGTVVAKGDVIARLDAESIRRELKAAAAIVHAAEAEARAAVVEHRAASEKLQRYAKHREALAGEEIVNARTEEKMAATKISAGRARVAEAVARVEQLKLLVENTAVVAPFGGVVAARFVDPGAQVGPGRPLVRIISADDLWVRFAIPEEAAGSVLLGSCVSISTASPPVTAAGVVETLSPQVDTELRLLLAEARLTVPGEWKDKLQAGLAAQVVVVGCTTP